MKDVVAHFGRRLGKTADVVYGVDMALGDDKTVVVVGCRRSDGRIEIMDVQDARAELGVPMIRHQAHRPGGRAHRHPILSDGSLGRARP